MHAILGAASQGDNMKSASHRVLLVGFAMLLVAIPVLAHHSVQAEFNFKETTVTGVLTKIEWINPHTYFYLDVKNPDGTVTQWSGESYPTGFFHRAGLTRDLFKVGDTLTMVLFLAKDPTTPHFGWMHQVKFSSGRTLTFDNNCEKDSQ
jgi:hypothetical protein